MTAEPFFVALAIFLFVTAGLYTLYLGVHGSRTLIDDRLTDLAVKIRMTDGAIERDDDDQRLRKLLLEWAVRRLPAPRLDATESEKLTQTLMHAGFSRPGAVRMFQTVRLIALIGFSVASFMLSLLRGLPISLSLVWGCCAGLLGSFIPLYFLRTRAADRQVKLRRELADVLDLLITCLESGLGIFETLRTVGREAQRQGRLLGSELLLVSAETTAGASLAQALRALAERTGVDDIKSVAAILIQSDKLGSQMAPALRACSDSLRTKRRVRAEEAAQKSTIKMLFPLVLFVLPAMLLVIIGPAMIRIIHTLSGQ